MSEYPLAHPVLVQRPGPQAETGVALHQQAVAVFVAAVLLQYPETGADALLVLPDLHVVDGQPAQNIYVSVGQSLTLDHSPILVQILYQVVAPVQIESLLVLDGRLPRPTVLLQPTTPFVVSIEGVHVRGHPDARRQPIVSVLQEDVVDRLRRRTSAQQLAQTVDSGVQRPPGFLEVGLRPQPAHKVILGDRTGTVGQQVFEYGQRFAVTAQGHGLAVAAHPEVAEETGL